VIDPSSLPGDPSELHLRIYYDDELWDTPQADTLKRWNAAVLHRRSTRAAGHELVRPSGDVAPDASAVMAGDFFGTPSCRKVSQ
jgi:hypothetical protein